MDTSFIVNLVIHFKDLGIGSGGRSGGGTSKSFGAFPIRDPPSELPIALVPATPRPGMPSIKPFG